MPLTTSMFGLNINAGESVTTGLTTDPHAIFYTFAAVALSDGTGLNKAQKVVTIAPTVTTGGTTYDLSAIAGGPNGSTVAFTKIKWVMIANLDSVNTLIIGGAASNQWTGIVSAATTTITLRPLGVLFIANQDATGMAVSGGSKSLLLAAGASTVSVAAIFVGEGS